MSVIPIIASVHDVESAIRHGNRNPTSRWYISKRLSALELGDLVPADWAVVSAGLPDFLKKDDDGDGEKKTCSQKDCTKDAVMFGKCKEHAKKKSVTAAALTRRQARDKMGGMTAAAEWDGDVHPRDRNGRFIEKFDIIDVFPSGLAADVGHFRGVAVGNRKGDMGDDQVIVKLDKDISFAGQTIKAGTELPVSVDDVESAPNPKARLDGKPAGPKTIPSNEVVDDKAVAARVPSQKEIDAAEAQYEKNVAAKDKLKEGGAARAKAEENLVAFRARIDKMYNKDGSNAPGQLEAVPDIADDSEVREDMAALGIDSAEYDKIVAELGTEERVSPEAIYAEAVIERLVGDLDGYEDYVDDRITALFSQDHPLDVDAAALDVDGGLPDSGEDYTEDDDESEARLDDLRSMVEQGFANDPSSPEDLEQFAAEARAAGDEELASQIEQFLPGGDDASNSLEDDPDYQADAADDNPTDELRAEGPDGELDPDYLSGIAPIRDLFDVDSGIGGWASGLNDHTMTQLANSLEEYQDAPDSIDGYYREKLDGLTEAATEMGIDDPTDLIEARRHVMNLGWAQAEQLQGILNGEPLGSHNPSALRNIADIMHVMPGSIRNFGGDHSFEELSDAIHHYLDNPGPPDETDPLDDSGDPDPVAEGSSFLAQADLDALPAGSRVSVVNGGIDQEYVKNAKGSWDRDWTGVSPGLAIGGTDIPAWSLASKSAVAVESPGEANPYEDLTQVQLEMVHDLEDNGAPTDEAIAQVLDAEAVDPDVTAEPTPAAPAAPAAPAPDNAAATNLRLMEKSAEKASSDVSPEVAAATLNGVLDDARNGRVDEAHKTLAGLMTKMKLGGKQRKRYRELLDSYAGVDNDDSAEVEAASVAESLSADNPVKERLAAKAGVSTTPVGSTTVPTTDPDVPDVAIAAADYLYNWKTHQSAKGLPKGVKKAKSEPINVEAKSNKFRSNATSSSEITLNGRVVGHVQSGKVGGSIASKQGNYTVGWASESSGWLAFDADGKEVRGSGLTSGTVAEAISHLLRKDGLARKNPEAMTNDELRATTNSYGLNLPKPQIDAARAEIEKRKGAIANPTAAPTPAAPAAPSAPPAPSAPDVTTMSDEELQTHVTKLLEDVNRTSAAWMKAPSGTQGTNANKDFLRGQYEKAQAIARVATEERRDRKEAAKSDQELLADVDMMINEHNAEYGDSEPGAAELAQWRRESIIRDLKAGDPYITVKGEIEHTVTRRQALAMLRAIGYDTSGIQAKPGKA